MRAFRLIAAAVFVLSLTLSAAENEFYEEYVFGNREKALQQLTPGSRDYYFYSCLHAFYSGNQKLYRDTLARFEKDHRGDGGIEILRNRELLSGYTDDPAGTLKTLIREFGLTFSHTKPGIRGDRDADFPTELDQSLISRDYLFGKYRGQYSFLSKLTPEGISHLFDIGSVNEKKNLLLAGNLPDPFQPVVIDVMNSLLKDTKRRYSFSSLPLHSSLTLAQLRALAAKHPQLLEDETYVEEIIKRLRSPENPTDEEMDKELDRFHSYVRTLSGKFNSLKLRICYEMLSRNLERGTYDRDLFIEYLSYPRSSSIAPRELTRGVASRELANVMINTESYTGLPRVSDDTPLITSCLEYFFRTEDTYESFLPYLTKDYLRRTFASARILAGSTDPEYFNMLSTYERDELTGRIEVTILPITPKRFSRDEKVELNVSFKNVSKAFVKVYPINALSYIRKNGKEPFLDFDVNGIAPDSEQELKFDKPQTARFTETITLAELSSPGWYLVDVIGNGRFARAVIVKGWYELTVRQVTDGQMLTVFDEMNRPAAGANVYIESQMYTTNKNGVCLIPFSSSPAEQNAVVSKGGVTSLCSFYHTGASYDLDGKFHLEDSSVIPGNIARVLAAPRLTLNGKKISIARLENPSFTVTMTGRDGLKTENTEEHPELSDTAEYVCEFRVPDYLESVSVRLEGEVTLPWEHEPNKLSVSRTFRIHSAEESLRIMDAYFTQENGEYQVRILGKNGEPIPHIHVNVFVLTEWFKKPESFDMQTDEKGIINLGKLKGAVSVSVNDARYGFDRTCSLAPPSRLLPHTVIADQGSEKIIPFQKVNDFSPGADPEKEQWYLVGLTRDVNRELYSDKLSISDSGITVKGLEPGIYRIQSFLPDRSLRLVVRKGKERAGYSVDEKSAITVNEGSPLRISSISEGKSGVVITLANQDEQTRVHAVGGFFKTSGTLLNMFSSGLYPPAEEYVFSKKNNIYASDRKLDPEYMYILNRKDDKVYVGNLLERPGLILNRIETEKKVDSFGQNIGKGDSFRGVFGKGGGKSGAYGIRNGGGRSTRYSVWYDFLLDPAFAEYNLKPDRNGKVVIPVKLLSSCRFVEVCAVNGSSAAAAVYRRKKTPKLATIDLRLAESLDPEKNQGQKSGCLPHTKGETLKIVNRASSDFVVFRSLGELYRYLTVLNSDPLMKEFSFVTDWASLSEEEKREKYSKYSCHELNFFIFRRDPDFFKTVVKPYLANKMHKTFMDDYLLDSDLSAYSREEEFSRLNIFEKILLGRKLNMIDPDFVQDLFEPDPAAEERAIETALGVFSGETDGTTSISSNRAQLKRKVMMDKAVRERAAMAAPAAPMKKAEKMMFAADEAEELLDVDDAVAEEPSPLFKNVDRTREYMENNYYGLKPAQTGPGLIGANRFWYDFASDGKRPFLSSNIGTVSGRFTDIMLALALTDLPFENPEHEISMKGTGAEIRFRDNALVFMKEIVPLKDAPQTGLPLMVKSRYFYQRDLSKRDEDRKPVEDEFLSSEIYFNDVTVVNPTGNYRKCDLFIQIPRGSIAFNVKGDIVRKKVTLNPYAVINERVFFYFPETGSYSQYPVQLYSTAGRLASGKQSTFDVKTELTRFDTESWEYIADQGKLDTILAYLRENGLRYVDLSRVYYLLSREKFYNGLESFLRGRHRFDSTVYSYSLMHGDLPGIRVFLKNHSMRNNVGWYFSSPLLTVEAVGEKWYQHLEYDPLVLPRAHTFGDKTGLDIPVLKSQYSDFLLKISHKLDISDNDRLQYVYYLLLQNRISEAISQFSSVSRSNVTPVMQYDYMLCYISFYKEDVETARKTAQLYRSYPVPKWRKLFSEVLIQIGEAEGKPREGAEVSRESKLTDIVNDQPALELEENDGRLTVRGMNLPAFEVRMYLIDVETLFSSSPFDQGLSKRFSYVKPGYTATVKGGDGEFASEIEIPDSFSNRNLFVEVTGKGLERSTLVFRNSLNVLVYENYGRLQVKNKKDGSLLRKVYVKVYGQKGGTAVFYKDGYTDMRGIFDYATLSSGLIDQVSEYSILVFSEEFGSKIVKVKPPKQ